MQASIPAPRRPQHTAPRPRLPPRRLQVTLRKPEVARKLHHALQRDLEATEQSAAVHTSIDHLLLTGWERTLSELGLSGRTPTLPSASQPDSLTEQVRTLWQLRQEAHGEGRLLSYWRRDGLEMRAAFRAWRTAARLQAHNRLLRKACRLVEAVQSDNIYQAARRFAPKTPKRRIQLRREDGGLQTHEMEFHQIVPWGTGTITHAH